MKKYIVYDDYKIGYIKDICTCIKCKERGRSEVFINDLNDNYLDCIKANDFDRIIYLGDTLNEAIGEMKNSFERDIQALKKEKMYLQKLVDLYSELKKESNKFIIKVTPNTSIETITRYGDIEIDAKLWKDEFIFKTNLVFNEVKELPFVLSVKSI